MKGIQRRQIWSKMLREVCTVCLESSSALVCYIWKHSRECRTEKHVSKFEDGKKVDLWFELVSIPDVSNNGDDDDIFALEFI